MKSQETSPLFTKLSTMSLWGQRRGSIQSCAHYLAYNRNSVNVCWVRRGLGWGSAISISTGLRERLREEYSRGRGMDWEDSGLWFWKLSWTCIYSKQILKSQIIHIQTRLQLTKCLCGPQGDQLQSGTRCGGHAAHQGEMGGPGAARTWEVPPSHYGWRKEAMRFTPCCLHQGPSLALH